MEIIRQNPETDNYDVNITVDEWKQILRLPAVNSDSKILDALEKWYRVPSHTASCTQLAQQYGNTFQYYSIQNIKLGKIAVDYLNRFKLVGPNGQETFWPVPWIEISKHKNVYVVRLRPELVVAIEELGLFD